MRIYSTKVEVSQTDEVGGMGQTHTHTHNQSSINPHLGFVHVFGRQIDKQRRTNALTITHAK